MTVYVLIFALVQETVPSYKTWSWHDREPFVEIVRVELPKCVPVLENQSQSCRSM